MKPEDDPRITKIGFFLRKTSIDEIPQFINILKGDMSIIGPRPVVKEELVQYNQKKNYYQLNLVQWGYGKRVVEA